MIAIMHIKLADDAPGRMLHLFDIGIDGHRTCGDDGTDELAGRRPAAEPKNQYRHQHAAVANVLANAVVGPEPRQCILQPKPCLGRTLGRGAHRYCFRLVDDPTGREGGITGTGTLTHRHGGLIGRNAEGVEPVFTKSNWDYRNWQLIMIGRVEWR